VSPIIGHATPIQGDIIIYFDTTKAWPISTWALDK